MRPSRKRQARRPNRAKTVPAMTLLESLHRIRRSTLVSNSVLATRNADTHMYRYILTIVFTSRESSVGAAGGGGCASCERCARCVHLRLSTSAHLRTHRLKPLASGAELASQSVAAQVAPLWRVRVVTTHRLSEAFSKIRRRDEQMAAVRVQLSGMTDVDGARSPANHEQMAACNTRSSSSGSPSPPARPSWLISTSSVSPATCTSQRAHLHLHLPRTLRHDSAAVESMAVRAYHATRLDSSDQAALP
jgi:hypothetical protein